MIKWIALATLAVGTGCEVKNVGDLDTSMVSDTSNDSSGAADSSTSGESSGNSMTSVGESSSAEASTSVGESTDSDGSSTGGCAISMCGPHDDFNVNFEIDDGKLAEDLIEVPCTLVDITGSTVFTFECTEDGLPTTHELRTTFTDYAYDEEIYEGREFLLSWMIVMPFWREDYFTLRSVEGELVAAGGRGSTVAPTPDFFQPIDPSVAVPMCGVEECAGDCYQRQRTAIEFQFGDAGEVLLDGSQSTADVGDLYLGLVAISEMRHDVVCEDIPDQWHEWRVDYVSGI